MNFNLLTEQNNLTGEQMTIFGFDLMPKNYSDPGVALVKLLYENGYGHQIHQKDFGGNIPLNYAMNTCNSNQKSIANNLTI